MKIGLIALKIREGSTRFEDRVYGAAELDVALAQTIEKDCAFVVQTSDTAKYDPNDGFISQQIFEQFTVVVALATDASQKDKTGLQAFDILHDARAELFRAILGWQMPDYEGIVQYVGGELLDFNRAYLWYQFTFEANIRVTTDDGVDTGAGALPELDTIYADIILSPNADDDLPWGNGVPISDTDFTDGAYNVDLTVDPYGGEYYKGFAAGFKKYNIVEKLLARKRRIYQ